MMHEQLAETAVQARLSQLDTNALNALLDTVIDTVGCIACASDEAFAAKLFALSASTSGDGPCSVAGQSRKLSPAGAAMMNATLGHGFDFDDAHLPSLAHLSTIVVPAAMAACESVNATGQTFLEAVLVGDEIGGRLGKLACSPESGGSRIRARGFFPTSVLGTIAAAVAVAKVLGSGVEATAQAITIACSYAAGLATISSDGNSTKRTQAGWAAQAGLSAAMLAHAGFDGPRGVFEGEQGFIAAFLGGASSDHHIDGGPTWICEEMSFKLYPVEYVLHPLLELAERACREKVDIEQVTSIEVSVPSRFATLFDKTLSKICPTDGYAAAFSGPYCVARTFAKSGAGLTINDFRDDFVIDARTQRFAERVHLRPQSWIDQTFPRHLGGSMRLLNEHEIVWMGTVTDVHGSPNRPISRDNLQGKFRSNMRRRVKDADEALDKLYRLPDAKDAQWISEVLTA